MADPVERTSTVERQAPPSHIEDDGEEELFARPKDTKTTNGKGGDPDDDDKPLTAKERRALEKRASDAETRAAESERTANYWANRGRDTPPPAPRAAPPKEPELDDTTAMEEFTKSPIQAFKKIAKQLGYVSKEEQEQYMRDNLSEFGQGIMKRISTDQQLLRDFPGLSDPTSAFSKRTMEIVDELTEGDQRKRVTFFKAAAKQAKLEEEMSGGKRRRARAADPDDEDEEDEEDGEETPAERRSRLDRQGPRASGRSARPLVDLESGGVMSRVMDAFDIKPERREELAKKVKVARRNAITEGM